MTPPNYRVRRATLDDLGALRPLWESLRLPVPNLEKRLTEFQVVETGDGKIVGAVGFCVAGRHAHVHSEAFTDFAMADSVRPRLWDRIHSLALNHGIARLWTQERAPFWSRNGFQAANDEALKKLPAAWGGSSAGWLTLPLKDETAIVSLEKELAMFIEAEKQRTNRAFAQARTLKLIATIIALILAIFVLGAAFYLIHKNPGILRPGR